MGVNLKNRSLLEISELSAEEIHFLLDLSSTLKAEKNGGAGERRLAGKNLCLIFEKT